MAPINQRREMPAISMFFGIIIQMLSFDNKEHHFPHIHARYGEFLATFNIETAEVLAGSMPPRQTRMIQAWIEIHKEELLADWLLAIEGEEIFKIDPLK